MGLFEQFPFTNFHEMNLDWLLGKVKQNTNDIAAIPDMIDSKIAEQKPIIIANASRFIDVTVPPEGFAACKCDGITDDTEAFRALLNYVQNREGGGGLIVPGKCVISSTMDIVNSISIVGLGTDTTDYDSSTAPNAKSVIIWGGALHNPMFRVAGEVHSFNLHNIALFGSNVASAGVQLNQLRDSLFDRVEITHCTCGLRIHVENQNRYDDGCMFNLFSNMLIRCTNGLVITRDDNTAPNSNTCHNVFIRCNFDATEKCIELGDCDNNTFIGIYAYKRGHANDNTSLIFHRAARSNVFLHFQGTLRAESGSANIIYHYDRENGQPSPIIEPGAKLTYTQGGNNAEMWYLGVPFKNVGFLINEEAHRDEPGQVPSFDIASAIRQDGLLCINPNTGMAFLERISPNRLFELWFSEAGRGIKLLSATSIGGINSLALHDRAYSGGTLTWAAAPTPAPDNHTGDIVLNNALATNAPVLGWYCIKEGDGVNNGRWVPIGTIAMTSAINPADPGSSHNTDEHAVGTIINSTNPLASGCVGWVCVEAGTPGVWRKYGALIDG